MVTQTRHITFLLALVIAVALAGCGENKQQAPPQQQVEAPPEKQVADTDQNPPKQPVEDAVRVALPPFLSLDSIELERIPTGPEAVKVNFKAIVVPKEDLCVVDRESEVAGTPTVTLLKVVQTAAAKASLYGSVVAHRAMDQWTLEAVQIQVGLKQFGEPRGAFPPLSYVTGGNEANKALEEQAANAKLQQQALKALVTDTVRANLPPFLSLDNIELELIPTGADAYKVNFKAAVVPKEDLCLVDRVSEVQGTPNVTLLKIVQASGAKASISGSVVARWATDQWTLQPPEIQGLTQFAKPLVDFPPQSYVTGRAGANKALEEQAARKKAADDKKALEEKARLEQEEQARIQAEIAATAAKEAEKVAHDKLIKATAKGTRYTGTIECRDQIQNIDLEFTEQDDPLIRVVVSNHDNAKQQQTFTGKLVFNPQPEKAGAVAYHIKLSPVGESKGGFTEFDYFYGMEGSLNLRLTDAGLEGEAHMTFDFPISLKRKP